MQQVAVITGAGSGIGRSLAKAFSDRGVAVVLAGRNPGPLNAVAAGLHAQGRNALTFPADVRDAGAVESLVEAAKGEYGRIDYMVNNAGIGMGGEMQEFTEDHWNRVIDINLRGVIHGINAAYPIMLRQGFGHIVNMSSFSGLCPSPLLVPYATVKHAVVGMSVSLRGEAKSRGVRVSAVCPGPVDTPMLDSAGETDLPKSSLNVNVRKFVTGGRYPYDPDQMSRHILRALRWNPAIIVPPIGMHATWIVSRWFPSLADKLAERAARDLRSQASTAAPGLDAARLADPVA
jgi:NAD(P)-dependent dehydrogenase (short-subunit alcohol dehydrogenase family)